MKTEEVLLPLNVKFTSDAIQKIRVVSDNLMERRIARNESERNNFEEFILLNAAEAKVVFSASTYPQMILVSKRDAEVSILKCNTTLTGGCPPPEQRIREGKLEDIDLFFFRGDWQKFKELETKVEDIWGRPLDVARLFLGRIPQVSDMREQVVSAIVSPALPTQSLIWKFKLDIVNYQKKVRDILQWMKENEIYSKVRNWARTLQ